ncbi:hypothetical protein AvCA_09620 [Azotobacter vinelandii CA]|uniref:Uncharacterized protein n=2 Tax=Azotobacter vinelandii TaxID=354 RepID=C1DNI0_AZOVD|nr:hypothetical protein Avin_09620 [Azotobacter vinelandii DJ]AGK15452.1 hypothetical protein AvCA_09620 [Azotobacter vinelandii CA]AGK19627.1 hypothetical protein AvCA6_09620 [Azotobacter vinelandii CA6]
MQGYIYDFGIVMGLIICTVAFLLVGQRLDRLVQGGPRP